MAGLNFGSKVLLPAIRGLPRVRVTALCSRDPVRGRALAREWKIPKVETDLRKFALDPNLDALILALPPRVQAGLIPIAAKAGKHLFCEKPLAHNTLAAARALREVRRSGVRHGMDFLFPELPAWTRMRSLLRQGRIGTPVRVEYLWYLRKGARLLPAGSWKRSFRCGGGLAGNFLSHILYNLEFLAGPIRRLEPPRKPLREELRIRCRAGKGIPAKIHVAFKGKGLPTHEVRVIGKKGTLVLAHRGRDYAKGFFLRIQTPRRRSPRSLAVRSSWPGGDGRIRPVRSLLRRFCQSIRSARLMRPNLEDGARIQAWLGKAAA